MQTDLSGKLRFFIGIIWIYFGGGVGYAALSTPRFGVMAWLLSAVMTAGGATLFWTCFCGWKAGKAHLKNAKETAHE